MAQTTCQDKGNISAILSLARDMQWQARRERCWNLALDQEELL